MCPEYEDLLVAYDALEREERAHLDAHLKLCPRCSDYLLLLSHLDNSFSALGAMKAPSGFRRSLSERLDRERKLSFVPEVLDFLVGVSFILLTGLGLSLAVNEAYLLPTVILLLFGLSVWAGLQAYNELRT